MELRQLRGFVVVARAGTVTEAANMLGLAPASVSERIRRLEGTLGVALFERTPRGMRLTEAGARLLDRAQGLLDHADEVRRAVTERRQRVRVGALEMLAAARLPSVVRRLAERRPDIDLEVTSLPRQVLFAELAGGGLDAGLLLDSGLRVGALGFSTPPDLDYLDVDEVSLILVTAPGHADRTLLVTAPECSARLAVDRVIGPEVPRRELPSVATVREWARQGLGMAMLPDFVVEADLASGALVALDVAAPTLALRLVWTRGREEPLRDVLYAMSA
ncbi:LysR family transcriptional regulator [Microtetraspora sp. AC03309]|uniref:LysR family transcriptional regulator n=1 Tax=Microtetraspora sp. AC03309 TaxID=2779376 RepID=UPI001E5326ED|nr:LysR family transcriptional regulator [Microtetraspora sp. AC03309]MCC5581709.1 LysR family transcriptional regulator [Microtetraspora sp. AC03309]